MTTILLCFNGHEMERIEDNLWRCPVCPDAKASWDGPRMVYWIGASAPPLFQWSHFEPGTPRETGGLTMTSLPQCPACGSALPADDHAELAGGRGLVCGRLVDGNDWYVIEGVAIVPKRLAPAAEVAFGAPDASGRALRWAALFTGPVDTSGGPLAE